MATKILTYDGLQKFYELIDEKYVDTLELNENKGIAWAVSNQDAIDEDPSVDPIYKVEIKLGDGLDFDLNGAITASGLSPATNSKLGTIKTYIDTYDEDDNPTGTDIGTTMVASDPDNAPDVLDRIKLVGVQGTREKGVANGYAPLNENGIVPVEFLPGTIDDVKEGYYDADTDKFYSDRTVNDSDPENIVITYDPEDEIEAMTERIYYDLADGKSYRYGGSTYVEISSGAIEPITIAEIQALFE